MADVANIDGMQLRPVNPFGSTFTHGVAGEALDLDTPFIRQTSTGVWVETDASSAAGVQGLLGVLVGQETGIHPTTTAIASGADITVLLLGEVFLGQDVAMVADLPLYLSDTTGLIADAPPTNYRPVGSPVVYPGETTATVLFFNPTSLNSGQY